MPRYHPLDLPVELDPRRSDLLAFRWNGLKGIVAVFATNDPEHHLRITFNGMCIVRLLDDMPFWTEDDRPHEFPSLGHFAFRVEGSKFAAAQSSAFCFTLKPSHWRFITHRACVDVVSPAQPEFTSVPASLVERVNEAWGWKV